MTPEKKLGAIDSVERTLGDAEALRRELLGEARGNPMAFVTIDGLRHYYRVDGPRLVPC